MSTQTPARLLEPPVPPYDSTPDEVYTFLFEYFKCRYESDQECARLAGKLKVPGEDLYHQTEIDMHAHYGYLGPGLYYYLQDSMYGRVC